MTVDALSRLDEFKALCLPCPDREISGAYIGDLLSWVMGKAEAEDAWITIMSNINIVAVATLTDVSCILLSEGVIPDTDVLDVARAKGVNVLSTSLTSYGAAIRIAGLI